MNKLMELANFQPKRPKTVKPRHVRKKRKIKDMLTVPSPASQSLHPVLLPSDVFDQPQPVGNKKIEFNISTNVPAALNKDLETEQNNEEKILIHQTLALMIQIQDLENSSPNLM